MGHVKFTALLGVFYDLGIQIAMFLYFFCSIKAPEDSEEFMYYPCSAKELLF